MTTTAYRASGYDRLRAHWTPASLARELGITAQAVGRWFRNERVPSERLPRVARITGIPERDLRPDLYE